MTVIFSRRNAPINNFEVKKVKVNVLETGLFG